MAKINENITIEGATLRFKNFSGNEGKYNAKGKRNFCVLLNDDLAERLLADGWNVKQLPPREEGEDPQAYLQVTVQFGQFPPRIVQVTSRGQTPITEDMVQIIDYAEIKNVDLTIRPYNWEVNGKTGVKAYLKTMYYTIAEDPLDSKYNDVPGTPESAVQAIINSAQTPTDEYDLPEIFK